MPEYRRFIAYFYEYINGKKQKNAGYAKVELRNGMWRILFRLTSDHQPQPPIQVYGFVRESGYLLGFLLGTMRPGREISEEWAYRSEAPIGKDRYRLEDLAGIWIQSGEDRTFLTVWDDDTVDPEKFVLELPSPEAVGSRERPQARPDEMQAIAPGEAGTMQSSPEAEANEPYIYPAAGDKDAQSFLSNGASEIKDFSIAVEDEKQSQPSDEADKAENETQSQPADGAAEVHSFPAAWAQTGQGLLSNGASEIKDFSIAAENEKQSQSPDEADKAENEKQSQPSDEANELQSVPAAGDQTEQSLLSNGASEMEDFSAAAKNEKQSQPEAEANELQGFPAAGNINDGPGARAECGEQSLCGKAGSGDGIRQANAGAREKGNAGAAAQTPDVMKELFGKRTRFQPFADNEITDCIMIMPCDIIRLQQGRWQVGRSSFLQHGFYQHRHLLLGRMSDGAYVLGVPGIFNPQEQYMAQMFGFVHFKLSRVCQKGRRYGYWYRVLEEE